MIESFENTFQIVLLLICTNIAVFRAWKYKSRTWTLLSFFYGCFLLGDIYWLLYLVFMGQTPQISVVSDLSWYAAIVFLYFLIRHISPPEQVKSRSLLAWLSPGFAFVMALYYMQRGEIVSNLIYAGLIGLLLYASLSRLTDKGQTAPSRMVAGAVLTLCLLEYALWTASCIWEGDSPLNPYIWIDFLLSISFLLFIPATQKAVET